MGLVKYNRNYEKYAMPLPAVESRSKVKPNITIACLLNPSTFNSLNDECSLLNLTHDDYKDIIKTENFDFFLCELTFSDNEDDPDNGKIRDIINTCKEKNICCVYWDTAANELFYNDIELTRRFDYVFTTDSHKTADYKKVLKSNNVFYLPYAIQPHIFNPIEKNITNKEEIITKNSDMRFERVLGTSKKILSLPSDAVRNDLRYIPREIFELLALGTTVLSPRSQILEENFQQIINCYNSDADIKEILRLTNEDKDLIDKLSILGQRCVFNSHTYTNRIDYIMQTIGLEEFVSELPGVSMVTSTNRPDSMENVFRNYENQNYKNKELIVILNNNKMDLEEWKSKSEEYKNVKVFQIDENQPLGRCLNHAIDNSDYPYFSKCDDDNYYAPNFLSDLMNTYKYADAEIVGKLSYYCYLEGCNTLAIMCPKMEHRYVNMLSGSALIIKREVFDKVRFGTKPAGSDTVFLRACIENGVRMYSSDRFNYVYKRHNSQQNHTWKMQDEIFLKSCKVVDITDEFIPRVTV